VLALGVELSDLLRVFDHALAFVVWRRRFRLRLTLTVAGQYQGLSTIALVTIRRPMHPGIFQT